MIEGTNKARSTPEYREQMTKTQKARRLEVSDQVKLLWENEEYRKHMSEVHSGENSVFWKGGISDRKYCRAFNRHLREQIRDKFGRKCFLCGISENDRKLSIHHCDYNKGQGCGHRWNLVPLCVSCHGKTNVHKHYYFNLLANFWAMNPEICL
jgi:hypothetical protein